MIKFKSTCEENTRHTRKITARTMSFMIDLVQDLKEAGAADHLSSTDVMLRLMAVVGMALEAALESDLDNITRDEDMPLTERREKFTALIDATIDACFKIVEDAMPIEVHTEDLTDCTEDGAEQIKAFAATLAKKTTH